MVRRYLTGNINRASEAGAFPGSGAMTANTLVMAKA